MSKLTTDATFEELCMACRQGDLESVEMLVSTGINVNQMDEWNYSPLILASLCGHEDIVKYLLEKGSAICDRDTFEGQRCIYNALTDSIRNFLCGFDITKAVSMANQTFASYISMKLQIENDSETETDARTADLVFKFVNDYNISFKAHRFILAWRSQYFKEKFERTTSWKHRSKIEMPVYVDAKTFQFMLHYIYLVPCFNHIEQFDMKMLKAFSKKLKLYEILDYIEELDQIPQGQSIQLVKCKNQIQGKIEERAREDFQALCERIIELGLAKTDKDEPLTVSETLQLFTSNVYPDVLIHIDVEENDQQQLHRVYFPAHKSILPKAEYFKVMFASPFPENQTIHDLISDSKDKILDRDILYNSPELIPIVAMPGVNSTEVLGVILQFMYVGVVVIPPHLAIEVLLASDMLCIERLRTMAATMLEKLAPFEEGYSIEVPSVSIYDILRAGWQTFINGIESFVAKEFATNLDTYINTPEFEEVVLESAERIENRQEFDSIELIDDIRYYIKEKYDQPDKNNENDNEVDDNDDRETETDDEQTLFCYEADLNKIDELLLKLNLEA